jgi:hypothetical protein
VPWQEVQVTDHTTPPLATYFVKVGITVEDQLNPSAWVEEMRQFKVRAPPGLQHTEELEGLAVVFVGKLGFQTTGRAEHK